MPIQFKTKFKWDTETSPNETFQRPLHEVIQLIRHLPNPYIGNKKKLLRSLHNFMQNNNLKFDTFLDAFTGSGVVGLFMKAMGKRVIANDLLACSYLNAVALIENSGTTLSPDQIGSILNKNTLESDFVQKNWMSTSNTTQLRRRFTENEAIQLDHIRSNIKNLSQFTAQSIGLTANSLVCMRMPFGFADRSIDIYNHRRKQIEKYGKDSGNHDRRIGIYYDDNLDLDFKKWFPKYVGSINKAVLNNSQIVNDAKIQHALAFFGIQNYLYHEAFKGGRLNNGQILKRVDTRKEQDGVMRFTQEDVQKMSFAELSSVGKCSCIATNCDVIDLLQSGFVDVECGYFDPPYGGSSSDYLSMYQFFEEFIYEEQIENLPHFKSMDRFSKKTDYEKNFLDLLDAAKNIPIWVFSYNDKSWQGLEHIISLIKKFRGHVVSEIVDYKYKYRSKNNAAGKEYLIAATV